MSSTAFEARSTIPERHGQPQREVRWPLAQRRSSAAPKKIRPSQTQFFIPLCLANHTSTNQVTTSLRNSIAVTSLLPTWATGLPSPVTQDVPTAIASSAVPAKIIGRWPRHPGEGADRSSPHWLRSGVRSSLSVIRLSQQNTLFLEDVRRRHFHPLTDSSFAVTCLD